MSKVVAFVPLKKNSQRLPNKNFLPLEDQPLYQHILNTLINVDEISETYIFSSCDKFREGAPPKVKFLKRDERLDQDETLGEEIYDAFIEKVEADIYILAHATSPFLSSSSVSKALGAVITEEFDSAFSAIEIKNFAWFDNKPLNYSLNLIPRTQDLKSVFIETSGFYVFRKEVWVQLRQRIGRKAYCHVVNLKEGLDIDEAGDFEMAKLFSSINKI